MSTVFVGANKSFTAADSDLNIFGGSGVETVRLFDPTRTASINANVEGVDFAQAVEAYTFQVTGNVVTIRLGGAVVASVVVQDDANGTRLRFDNGGADLRITGLNQVTLGGVAVSTAAGGAGITSAQMGGGFNGADVAPGLPPDGGLPPPPPPGPVDPDTVTLTVFPDVYTTGTPQDVTPPITSGPPASTYNAPRVFTPGGTDQQNSLNDDDILEGKNADATKNTLNVDFVNDADTGDTDIVPTLINIGNINTKFIGDGSLNLDLQDATNVKSVNVLRVDDDASVVQHSNIGNPPNDLSVQNSSALASSVQFNFTDLAVSGAADTVKVLLNNALIDELVIQEGPTSVPPIDEGIETQNFTSSGGGNVIATTFFAEDLRTFNLAGAADLTINVGTPIKLTNGGNPTEAELSVSGASFTNAAGSFNLLDASTFTADLDVNIAAPVGAVVDGTSGTPVAFVFKGGSGDDIVRVGSALGAEDNLNGGGNSGTAIGNLLGGGDILDTFASGTSKLLDGTLAGFEHYLTRFQGTAGGTLTSDTSLLGGLQDIFVRNEGFNGINAVSTSVRFTLDNVSKEVAANGITQFHGTTGNNNVNTTTLEVDLKDASGTADLVKVVIADGINNEPIHNFRLDLDGIAGGLEDNGKVENVSIHDIDSESNAFILDRLTEHTGTLLLTGGKAGQNFSLLDLTFDTSDSLGNNGIENAFIENGILVGKQAGELNFNAVSRQLTDQPLQFAVVDARGQSSNVNVTLGKAAAAQVFFGGTGNDTVDFSTTFNENDGSFAAPNDGGAGIDRLRFVLTATQNDPIHAINFELLRAGASGNFILDTDDTSGLNTIELISSAEAATLDGVAINAGLTLTVENKTGATTLLYSGRGDIDTDARQNLAFNALTLVDDEQTAASAFKGAADTQTAIFDNRDPYALANINPVTAGGSSASTPTSFEYTDTAGAGVATGTGTVLLYNAGKLTVNGLENFVVDSRLSLANNVLAGDTTVGDFVLTNINGVQSDTLATVKAGSPAANKAGQAFETDVALNLVQGNAANNSITLVDGNGITGRFSGIFNSVGNGGKVTATGDGRDETPSAALVDLANTAFGTSDGDGFSDDLLVNNTNNVALFEGHNIDLKDSNGTGISITTGGGADRIIASQQAETVNAGNGDNFVNSRGGNDVITTGTGDDLVNGGGDDDQVFTGTGNDIIRGGTGQDNLQASDGNDIFVVVGSIDAAQAGLYSGAGATKLLGNTSVVGGFINVDGIPGYTGGTDIATLQAGGAELVTFAELTNVTSATDTDPGETYNAGAGTDGLVAYGKTSFIGSVLTGVENLKAFSDISLSESQYQSFTRIRGDSTTILRIVDDGGVVTAGPLVFDFDGNNASEFAGVGRLDLGGAVQMNLSKADMAELIAEGLDVISGVGNFNFTDGIPVDMQGRVVSNEIIAANPGEFINFTPGFSNAQIEALGVGGIQVVDLATATTTAFPAGSVIIVVDTQANWQALSVAQIQALGTNNANDVFNIEPQDVAGFTVAQANALGLVGKFSADDGVGVFGTGADITTADFATIAKISGNLITVDVTPGNAAANITVAQATALQAAANLSFLDADAITIVGDDQALVALNLDTLAGQEIDQLDDNVDNKFVLTIAQADAIRLADGPGLFDAAADNLSVIASDAVILTGTGAQLAALDPTLYNNNAANLGGSSVSLDATDDVLNLTVTQFNGFVAQGIKFTGGDAVILKDTGALLAGINAAAAVTALVDSVDATDNAVNLSVTQATGFKTAGLKFAADDKLTITFADAEFAGLIAGGLTNANLGGLAPVVLDAADNTFEPNITSQTGAVFNNGQVFQPNPGADVIIATGTGADFAGATVSFANIKAINVDSLNSSDNVATLTVTKADLIRTLGLTFAADDDLTITGAGADLVGLTFSDYTATKIGGDGTGTLDATDNTANLTIAQATALTAAGFKFAANDALVIADTGANLAAATFNNLKTATLGGASVILNATDDAVTITAIPGVQSLVAAGLQFAASDVITVFDTNADILAQLANEKTTVIGGSKVQLDTSDAAIISVANAATIFTNGATFVPAEIVTIADLEGFITPAISANAVNWQAIGVDLLKNTNPGDDNFGFPVPEVLTLFSTNIRVVDTNLLFINSQVADTEILTSAADYAKFDFVAGAKVGILDDQTGNVLAPTAAQVASILANNLKFNDGAIAGTDDAVTVTDTIANGAAVFGGDWTTNQVALAYDSVKFTGSGGAQTVTGTTGADFLEGGAAGDSLTGGAGIDKFSYLATGDGGDTITDFVAGAGGDMLSLSKAGFGVVNALLVGESAVNDFPNGNVLLFNGSPGFLTAEAAAVVIAADASVTETVGFFVFFNGTTGQAQLIHSTDLAANGAETLIASFSNITTAPGVDAFTAANFIFT